MSDKKICFFKSTQQAIPPGQVIQLVVECPQSSHNSAIADANGQTKAGCPFYHDDLKRCKIEMAVEYGAGMWERKLQPQIDADKH